MPKEIMFGKDTGSQDNDMYCMGYIDKKTDTVVVTRMCETLGEAYPGMEPFSWTDVKIGDHLYFWDTDKWEYRLKLYDYSIEQRQVRSEYTGKDSGYQIHDRISDTLWVDRRPRWKRFLMISPNRQWISKLK